VDKRRRVSKEADDRARKIHKRWMDGASYRVLSEALGLSIVRVRQIVQRGKEIQAKEEKRTQEKTSNGNDPEGTGTEG
jgi:hypothetical protein